MSAKTEDRKLPLIVLTSPLPAEFEDLLDGRVRVRVFKHPEPLSDDMLCRRLKGAAGAVTLPSDSVTAKVFKACPALKVVANCAVGTDNIDLEAAGSTGVVVTHTPEVLTEASADAAWTLLLSIARHGVAGDRLVRRGRFKGWQPDLLLGMDLRGKVLGIVGMGRIGRAVARRAPAFGMHVVYTQRHRLKPSQESALSARFLPLDELVATADVISLHCPLTPETHHLMNRKRLTAMKEGALLVNISRGGVVDEAALVDCLRSGHLGGAGLDVYENEPALAEGLTRIANTMLLPHIASAGRETRAAMARLAVSDCLAVIEGREPAFRVV
jgi:glyoxylate reductase